MGTPTFSTYRKCSAITSSRISSGSAAKNDGSMPSGICDAAPEAVDGVAALAPDDKLLAAFTVDGVVAFVAFSAVSLADEIGGIGNRWGIAKFWNIPEDSGGV